ncbi:MAG: hypothetical protein Q7T25_16525, partial [Sideroxyarcus sp.]|nr:hypothetical protein [Sideroxyarcus sp.]
MRNQIMQLARAKLSDFGLAMSLDMKRAGKTLAECEERYALKRFQRGFKLLTENERSLVWMDIVHAAGTSRAVVNINTRKFGIAGRTFLIASLGFAVFNVLTADDKTRQLAKEGTVFAAGAA